MYVLKDFNFDEIKIDVAFLRNFDETSRIIVTKAVQMAKELGYSTFFWSLAYVDWNVDSQPTHEEAFSKLTARIHPGAIVLLHNTSKTNGEILDELLTKWEEMGYSFGTLEDLVK